MSIVIPAYNEAAVLPKTLGEVKRVMDATGLTYEVVVVDDGSKDGTADAVRGFTRLNGNCRLVSYPQNQGKGYALKQGALASKGDVTVLFDADLDLPADNIPILIKRLQEDNLDIVVGSKRHPDSKVFYPLTRRCSSWCFHTLVRLLLDIPLKDTQVGLKVFRQATLARVLPSTGINGFAFDVELLALAALMGFRMAEAPIDLNYKRFSSKLSARATINALWDTFHLFYQLRIRKIYSFRRSSEAP